MSSALAPLSASGRRYFTAIAQANRLTADGRHSVCLLEAGPPDWHPYIHIPAGFLKTLTNPSVNWLYQSEPGPQGSRWRARQEQW